MLINDRAAGIIFALKNAAKTLDAQVKWIEETLTRTEIPFPYSVDTYTNGYTISSFRIRTKYCLLTFLFNENDVAIDEVYTLSARDLSSLSSREYCDSHNAIEALVKRHKEIEMTQVLDR